MECLINEQIKFIFDKLEVSTCDDIIKYFKSNYLKVMKFFNLQKLEKPLIIKIYNNYEKFKKQCAIDNNISTSDIPFYAIGYAKDEKEDSISYINELSLSETKKIDYFKDKTLDSFNRGLIHEFVHICHFQMCDYNFNGEEWISEGIATYLANQYENQKFTASLEEIKNHKTVEYHNYRALFDIIIDNYSHEEVIDILKGNYSNKLLDEVAILYKDKKYINSL